MKISELVDTLQALQSEHGDIEVTMENDAFGYFADTIEVDIEDYGSGNPRLVVIRESQK